MQELLTDMEVWQQNLQKVSFKTNKGNEFGDFGYCLLNRGRPLNTGFTGYQNYNTHVLTGYLIPMSTLLEDPFPSALPQLCGHMPRATENVQ